MKVLVCGGRDYQNKARVFAFLDYIAKVAKEDDDETIEAIVHGGCDGADYLAEEWAHARGVQVEVYLADWKTHGKKAGPMRNQRMINEAKPDICIAFPGGRGTADMVRRARAADVPTMTVKDGQLYATLAPGED